METAKVIIDSVLLAVQPYVGSGTNPACWRGGYVRVLRLMEWLTPAAAPRRDLVLDAWRGISVLMVIVGHAMFHRFEQSLNTFAIETNMVYPVLGSLGTLGVKFFFVISGYIITKLLLQEHARTGKLSLSAFYVRRAFRILPALWLFVVAVLAARSAGLIVDPGSLVTAIFFLCNTAVSSCGWFLGHLWSLSIEEQFYLVWPLLLAIAGCRKVPQLAFVIMTAFLLLAQLSLLMVDWLDNGLNFACIAAGVLYASSPTTQARIHRLASLPSISLAVLLVFGRPLIPLTFPGQYRLHDIATPMLICFLIFSSFRYRAVLERWFLVRALAGTGLVSYGLYLWQQLFLAPPQNYPSASPLTWWPLFVPVALLSYFVVERPMLGVGAMASRLLQQRKQLPEPRDGEQMGKAVLADRARSPNDESKSAFRGGTPP